MTRRGSGAALDGYLSEIWQLTAPTRCSSGCEIALFVTPLYEERYTLIAPAGMLPSAGRDASTRQWSEAAELPLALLTQDMRVRQIIDTALPASGSPS